MIAPAVRVATRYFSTSIRAATSTQNSSSAEFNGEIPTDQIQKKFVLSGGPGGQNVNKNPTKVEIRFKLENAKWIPENLRAPLKARLHNRINANGEVIIVSDRTREQNLNLADCFDKLRSTLYAVQRQQNVRIETEEDTEIIRKKAEHAAEVRLAEKRRLSQKKQMRSDIEL